MITYKCYCARGNCRGWWGLWRLRVWYLLVLGGNEGTFLSCQAGAHVAPTQGPPPENTWSKGPLWSSEGSLIPSSFRGPSRAALFTFHRPLTSAAHSAGIFLPVSPWRWLRGRVSQTYHAPLQPDPSHSIIAVFLFTLSDAEFVEAESKCYSPLL